MTPSKEFERYLNLVRLRLKQLLLARGLSALAIASLLITVAAVFVAVRQGFPDSVVITARILLVAVAGAIVYGLIVRPGRRVDADGATDIERRAPEFGGRARTWLEIQGTDNPLEDLLAEDALHVAAEHAPETAIPQREFSGVLAAGGLAAAVLLFLAIAGPGNYAFGVRHLWFGWAFPGVLPPQSIEVSPGNSGIRKGGSVSVEAVMQGFDPSTAFVHARFGDADWQQVEMAEDADGFDFTFFSVREPLEYYVSAANVRSQTYTVNVVDLPVVENLSLTYRYPAWTGREPETRDPGGDVRAIADTEVEVHITTDRPMTPGELVIGDQPVPLQLDGNGATASFTVSQDDQYFVAAKVGGEQIRLTDDYFVTLLQDAIPQIEFARPGRDWSASSIEEVTAEVSAHDDFRLESLELRYTVNGGEWQSIDMPVDGDSAELDHVFFLESMADQNGGEPLRPGDLISYYAVAGDRANTARTDMFFIDVQPFDRRYSQSQQSGGGGGQQGQRQDEISARQREIIISTWNLIREQQEERQNDPAYVTDNASLLARVQATLREQVDTLARRTEARQLTASGDDIARFVEHLDKASEAMVPAAERLSALDLENAIQPEQEALQHLLAAEAVFTDISVSLQTNNRGGGGGQAGRDLTEMFELEMDLEKNQYETGSQATPDAPDRGMEEAADELEELARRQEQLANNRNRDRQPTPAERWQQEMLRRDVEELRQRLERMQQQASARQQQGAQGGAQSGGSASQSGESDPQDRQLDELQRRLDSAVRAMNEADEAMRNGGNPEDLERATEEARRQLQGARDRANEEIERAMQASVDDLAERSDELYESQQSMEDRLTRAVRGVNVGRNANNRLDSGMSIAEEYALAEEKRRLQADIQRLQQDARTAAQRLSDSQPRTADQIREALDKLDESEIESRIAVSAAYIEQGEAVYVVTSEPAVTQALRELSQDLDQAVTMARAGPEARPEDQAEGPGFEQTLAEAQRLRRELQRMAGNGDPRGGGALTNRGRDDLQRSTGIEVGDLETTRDFDDRADALSDDVVALFRDFRGRGVAVQDLDELRRLAADVRAYEFSGNPALLEEEARRALAGVEQLELALSRAGRQDDTGVRTSNEDEIPEAHREIVADYYRRLGETGDEPAP